MIEKLIRYLIAKYMPGWTLAPPGYHKHQNPVRKKKVYSESTLEDACDMVIEIAKARREKNDAL